MLPSHAILSLTTPPGVPVGARADGKSKFIKAVLKAGHTVPRTDGSRMDITPAMLATMAESTNRFIANGGKVPAPSGSDPHGNADNAEANKGWWGGFVVQGDTLYATLETPDESAVKLTDVSINAPAKFKDTKGAEYEWPILHVALTPTPAVTDLGEFVKIAASGRVIDVPVFRLSQEQPMERLKAIALSLGLTEVDKLDDAGLNKAIDDRAKILSAAVKASETATATLAATQKELADIKASRKPDPEATPLVMRLTRENRSTKLQARVLAGNITPAVRDRLAADWCPDGDGLKLSLDEASDRRFENLIAALGENDPVKLGEQSAAQRLVLSRVTPGDTKVNAAANDEYMKGRVAAITPAKL